MKVKHLVSILAISGTAMICRGQGIDKEEKIRLGFGPNIAFGESKKARLGIGLSANYKINNKLKAGLLLGYQNIGTTNDFKRTDYQTTSFIGGYESAGQEHILSNITFLQFGPQVKFKPLSNLNLEFNANYLLSYMGNNSSQVYNLDVTMQHWDMYGQQIRNSGGRSISHEVQNDFRGLRRWQHYVGVGASYTIFKRLELYTTYNFGVRDMADNSVFNETVRFNYKEKTDRFNYLQFGINYTIIKL